MINRVVLVGRLTRDPELRTAGERKVCNFTLAVKRPFSQGSQTDFIPCVVWSLKAEALYNYTSKGDLIGVEGSIQTRSYDNKDGQKVHVTEVNVEQLTFLSTKTSPTTNESAQPTKYSSYYQNEPQRDKKVSSVKNNYTYETTLLDYPQTSEYKQESNGNSWYQPDGSQSYGKAEEAYQSGLIDDDLPF